MATNARVVDFLSLLRLLNPAKQFLICSIEHSIQILHDDIVLLREEEGAGAADKIAVLRAEIAYSQTIQANFLQEVLNISPRIRGQRSRRHHQQRRSQEGAILHTITNTHQPQYQPRRNYGNDCLTAQCYNPGSSLRKRNDLQGKDGSTSALQYLTNGSAQMNVKDYGGRMGGQVTLKVSRCQQWWRRARRIQVAMATNEVIRKAAGRKAYGYSLNNGNGT
jgi:hypothetical protein